MVEYIRSADSENGRLQNENTDLKTKLQENSRRSDIDMYVKKIHKLEEEAHGDRVLMDIMQRKLKDIGSEHSQYVMKIQTEADDTIKQLREQNNALLQTIWVLECDNEHLEAVLLDKQLDRRFQPHRQRRRQQRGYRR
uniref:Uncharacterized protein n=1 Tax=Magallana gigas TaxID=29159 RepID=K1QJT6_MAGGI